MAYTVKELFYTLQGEGAQTGRAAVFCRFAGCNLWSGREADRARAVCRFCDTDFLGTDGEGGGRFADAEALAHALLHRRGDEVAVVVRGGGLEVGEHGLQPGGEARAQLGDRGGRVDCSDQLAADEEGALDDRVEVLADVVLQQLHRGSLSASHHTQGRGRRRPGGREGRAGGASGAGRLRLRAGTGRG